MKNLNNQQGFVLVLAMIVLTAVLLLVASMTRMLQSEIDFYSYNNNEKKAFYAAEAGIAYGKELFWNDDADGVWNSDGTLIGSEIDKINNNLTGNAELDSLTQSKFYHPDAQGQPAVELKASGLSNDVDREVITSFYIYNSSFNNSLSAGGDIDIGNNGIINGNLEQGDIYTKGYIYGPKGNIIEDNSSSDKVTITDSDIYNNVSEDYIPKLDFGQLETIATNTSNGYIIDDDPDNYYKFSNIGHDIGSSFTYVKGDLEIDPSVNDFNGSGVLVVTGQLIIKSNVAINRTADNTDYFTIIVKGDGHTDGIVLDIDNAIDMQGFIYSYGDTDFKNSLTIDGAIVTQGSLTVGNSLEINYESGYLDKLFDWGISFPDSEGEQKESIYKIISWSEN